jgi:hypothetical protein
VINPLVKHKLPGDQVSLITSSCPDPCHLVKATHNGRPIGLRVGTELGFPWYQDFTTIHGGDTDVLRIETQRSGVWSGNSSGGTYALTYLQQNTVKPTRLSVAIHAPAGNHIVWTNLPMRVEGADAYWQGVPTGNMRFEVRFAAPIPLRWIRDLNRGAG